MHVLVIQPWWYKSESTKTHFALNQKMTSFQKKKAQNIFQSPNFFFLTLEKSITLGKLFLITNRE